MGVQFIGSLGGFCLVLSAVSTSIITIAMISDHWEFIDYNPERIQSNTTINDEFSIEQPTNFKDNFTTVTLRGYNPKENVSKLYFYPSHSGIWKKCDTLADENRVKLRNLTGTHRQCLFFYHDDDFPLSDDLGNTDLRATLLRAHKSAMSCLIVSVIVLGSAALIGMVGMWQKMVPACMVTGVMYIIGATFIGFGLILIHIKIDYQNIVRVDDKSGAEYCFSVRDIDPKRFCPTSMVGREREFPQDTYNETAYTNQVSTGWPVTAAWLSVLMAVGTGVAWLFMARAMRMESSQMMQTQW